MITVALAIASAQIADLLTFISAATIFPIAFEANPLIRWAFNGAGLPGVIALKLAAVALMVLIAYVAEPIRPLAVAIAVTLGLVGAFTNTFAVVLLAGKVGQ